jgi:nitrous oxidase accessory protein
MTQLNLQGMKYVTAVLVGIYAFASEASVVQVCPSCEVTSLSAAFAMSSPHDTIVLQKGTYPTVDVIIDHPITLRGEGAVLDANWEGGILDVRADSVYFSGLIFNHVKTSYVKDVAALLVYGSDHFIFEDLTFNQPFFAMLIQKSKNGIIRNNVIHGDAETEAGSGNGIQLWHSHYVLIEHNQVFNMRDGIYLEFVSDCVTQYNLSKDCLRYGLHFMFSDDNVYSHNVFDNNGAGVAVMFSRRITMTHNLFQYNWGSSSYGLLLKEIYDAEITDNTFKQNTIAINSEGSTRINYINNVFSSNGWAVRIAGGCFDNVFTKNDFLNNTFDISYQGRQNGNSFDGNYWSDYTGYDLDKDGVGDVSYRPVKLFSYIVNRTPETIVLHRSLFVDILNFSEKVSPIFTPKDLQDLTPVLKPINRDRSKKSS